MQKEYWLIDVTELNNSWRLPREITDSNCKVIHRFSEEINSKTTDKKS